MDADFGQSNTQRGKPQPNRKNFSEYQVKKSQDGKDTGSATLCRAGYAHPLFARKKGMGYRIKFDVKNDLCLFS